jgi:hypothetical protein
MNIIVGNLLRLSSKRSNLYSSGNINYSCANNLVIFSHKSFCFKYVPYKRIEFHNTNFHEPTTKLFQVESHTDYKMRKRIIFSFSFLCYLTLLSQPLQLNLILLNLMIQPCLYYNYIKMKKRCSHSIMEMDLLKNGQQLLIKTENESIYIVHISDFEEILEDVKEQKLIFKTFEKEFFIDLKLKTIIFNDEIISIIRESRIIDTNKSFQNYHRLTINR